MKVILIGYMGSGKSVIGQKLAAELQIPAMELDDLIEKKAQVPIKTIFSDKGELYFRKLEHELFLECIRADGPFVLSTGGGTPCYYNHHEWLRSEGCISIYLKASVAILSERVSADRRNRPLLANLPDNELEEYIAKHLFDRNYYYHQATFTVTVDAKAVPEIVSEIRSLLT